MFYELAKNPECQQKLRDEVNAVLEKHKGEFSHETLKDMTYLEACVSGKFCVIITKLSKI